MLVWPRFRRSRLGWPVILIAVVCAFLGPIPQARAATIVVNTTSDEFNTGAACSLREAIQSANSDSAFGGCTGGAGPDTIALLAGTYTLSIPGVEDANEMGDLDITSNLTVQGAGAGSTTINGNGVVTGDRVLDIDRVAPATPSQVTISGLTVTGGVSVGAGIANTTEGNVTIIDSVITGNNASSNGGIENDGVMTITGSSITGNTANIGGGIRNESDGVLTISNTTISGNVVGSTGGGIYAQDQSVVTITNSAVSGNTAGNRGGGIHAQNEARVTITNSTVRDNSASLLNGGGLSMQNSPVGSIADSTLENNSAGAHGGAVYIRESSQLTITNSTVSGNKASVNGGGLSIEGPSPSPTVTLASVTITGNSADSDANGSGDGGGIHRLDGTVTLRNTILAGNTDPSSDPDCFGSIGSQGYNLVGAVSGGCAFGSTAGDQTGTPAATVDPKLGVLVDNGGPTQTHALLAGSPAIDAGNPATPGSGGSACPATDQRGLARNCDIGAYELVLCGTVPINRIGTSGDNTLTGTDGPDGFLAGDGNDTATGLAGDDALCLERGNDTADGGEGNDYLDGGDGDDALTGGPGNDTILGGPGNDTGVGVDGNDTFSGGDGNDKGNGGAGKDLLKGEKGKDRLNGGSGKDKLIGGGGKDRLNCGAGKKEVGKGGAGKDTALKCEKGKA